MLIGVGEERRLEHKPCHVGECLELRPFGRGAGHSSARRGSILNQVKLPINRAVWIQGEQELATLLNVASQRGELLGCKRLGWAEHEHHICVRRDLFAQALSEAQIAHGVVLILKQLSNYLAATADAT